MSERIDGPTTRVENLVARIHQGDDQACDELFDRDFEKNQYQTCRKTFTREQFRSAWLLAQFQMVRHIRRRPVAPKFENFEGYFFKVLTRVAGQLANEESALQKQFLLSERLDDFPTSQPGPEASIIEDDHLRHLVKRLAREMSPALGAAFVTRLLPEEERQAQTRESGAHRTAWWRAKKRAPDAVMRVLMIVQMVENGTEGCTQLKELTAGKEMPLSDDVWEQVCGHYSQCPGCRKAAAAPVLPNGQGFARWALDKLKKVSDIFGLPTPGRLPIASKGRRWIPRRSYAPILGTAAVLLAIAGIALIHSWQPGVSKVVPTDPLAHADGARPASSPPVTSSGQSGATRPSVSSTPSEPANPRSQVRGQTRGQRTGGHQGQQSASSPPALASNPSMSVSIASPTVEQIVTGPYECGDGRCMASLNLAAVYGSTDSDASSSVTGWQWIARTESGDPVSISGQNAKIVLNFHPNCPAGRPEPYAEIRCSVTAKAVTPSGIQEATSSFTIRYPCS